MPHKCFAASLTGHAWPVIPTKKCTDDCQGGVTLYFLYTHRSAHILQAAVWLLLFTLHHTFDTRHAWTVPCILESQSTEPHWTFFKHILSLRTSQLRSWSASWLPGPAGCVSVPNRMCVHTGEFVIWYRTQIEPKLTKKRASRFPSRLPVVLHVLWAQKMSSQRTLPFPSKCTD